jgi:hypothetical protein
VRRIGSDEEKRQAPKWRQVVDTVDWLTAQIEPGTQFQIIAFNRDAWSLVDATDGTIEGDWVTATDGTQLTAAVDALRAIVPGTCAPGTDYDDPRTCGATSLHAAFEAMNEMLPRPDNVYLLVDGLPTMGASYPNRSRVTGRERYQHFISAYREVGRNTPINVLLYPLEGDPISAEAYWTLALATGGSLMAPSEDWP